MRTISIVLGLKKIRQAEWGVLEVVICATSEICQLVVVVERDNEQTLINANLINANIVLDHHHLLC